MWVLMLFSLMAATSQSGRSTAGAQEFLDPQGLANYLSVPVRTVYAWRARGGGPPGFRVGKHVRYRKREVERWIDQQQATAAS